MDYNNVDNLAHAIYHDLGRHVYYMQQVVHNCPNWKKSGPWCAAEIVAAHFALGRQVSYINKDCAREVFDKIKTHFYVKRDDFNTVMCTLVAAYYACLAADRHTYRPRHRQIIQPAKAACMVDTILHTFKMPDKVSNKKPELLKCKDCFPLRPFDGSAVS